MKSRKTAKHRTTKTPTNNKVISLNQKLLQYAATGDIKNTADCLKQGADPDFADGSSEKNTPLLLAAHGGHTNVVALLLDHHATIDKDNTSGCTPLWIAIKKNHNETAILLAERGADINHRSATLQASPLHAASGVNNVAMIEYLIAKGAIIDVTTNEGYTPLHLATQYAYIEAVKLLLKHKANPNARIKNGNTSALQLGIESKNSDCVDALLAAGAETQHLNSINDMSALHLAANMGLLTIAKLILAKDARLNTTCHNKETTPLHEAANNDHAEVVKLLLDAGADTTKTLSLHNGTRGYTAFLCAVMKGYLGCAEVFLTRGVNVNQALPRTGNTALHIAVTNHDKSMVALLLAHGASLSIKNTSQNETPLELTIRFKDEEMMDWILQHSHGKPEFHTYLKNLIATLASSEHDPFDLVELMRVMQQNGISNETILSLIPRNLLTLHTRDSHSVLGRTIRELSGASAPLSQRYSIFTGAPTPQENRVPQDYEHIRQTLLTLAFNPKSTIGAGLHMHGSKESYGLREINEETNCKLSPRK